MAGFGLSAHASPVLPTGGQFVAGGGVIGAAGPSGLQINQSGARGVIDWTSFSIGAGGRVSINNGSGATLNRVTGLNLSQIDGVLSATGSVYLVNPQGVVVGANGKVLAGGSAVLSTRNIDNTAFMAGGAMSASGASVGDVTNQGVVLAKTGDVIIIGDSVANSGSITANNGTVTLAAADSVLMAPMGGIDRVYVAADTGATGNVTDSGRIRAAAAALTSAGGNVFTLAGNRTGLIQAQGTQTVNGQVWLAAPNGAVSVAGDVSAQAEGGAGGKIVASGQTVSVAQTATLDARGSSGGQVLVGVSDPGAGLAQFTTIADGATILAGGPNGGGSIETSGHALSLGSARIDAGAGGAWLVDPTNLTIDSAAASTIVTSLNGGTNVTETTTSAGASGAGVKTAGAGDITVASAISWTGAGSLTLTALNNANINAAITGSATGGLTVTAAGAINVAAPVSTGGTLSMTATGGNLTLGAAVAGGAGATLSTSANLINSAGANAVSSSAGRWLIYSANPSGNTLDGLSPGATGFIQYAAASGAAPAQSTGNGLLYKLAPSLSALTLSGSVTKVYDANTTASTASLASATISATGLVNGDKITPTAAVYAQSDVGSGLGITVNSFALKDSSGTIPVYGYAVPSSTLVGYIGSITPAPLSVTVASTPTKTYDTTTTASVSGVTLTGFQGSDGGTIAKPTSATYASAEASTTPGDNPVTINFAPGNVTLNAGTKITNYSLPSTFQVAGTINPATVDVVSVYAVTKVYDGTTDVRLDTRITSLYGVNASDLSAVNLDKTNATGVLASADVSSHISVVTSGFVLTGAKAHDYVVVQPTLVGAVTPATLTVQGLSVAPKTYDGSAVAAIAGAATLAGVIGADNVGLSGSPIGAFASADVGAASNPVTVTGLALNGAKQNDYLLSPLTLNGTISPKALTATLGGVTTKTYTGDAVATVDPANYGLSGFVAGQSAAIVQSTGSTYNTANAGTALTVTSILNPSDYSAASGTTLSNYVLPTAVTGAGQINKATVSVNIVGNPSKVYDATTTAPLAPVNYQITGLVGGDTAIINQTSGTYANANAGIWGVSTTLSSSNFTFSGASLANYVLPTTATGFGTITAAQLGVGLVYAHAVGNPTKVYDGTTVLTTSGLAAITYQLTGFQGADGATVSGVSSGAYATANAGVQPFYTNLTAANFAAVGATNLSNYVLPTIAYGTGTITPLQLSASVIGTPTKVYNGSTTATTSTANYTLTGFIAGQGGAISQPATANYQASAAGSQQVTAQINTSDVTVTNATMLSNYALPATATGAGLIKKADLTVVGSSVNSKVYDGNTAATLNTAGDILFGAASTDTGGGVSLVNATSAAFSQSDAGTGLAASAAFGIAGTAASNYTLVQPTLTANITPRPVQVTLTTQTKTYDGTTAATLTAADYVYTGLVSGQSISNTQTSALYDSADVLTAKYVHSVTTGQYVAGAGTNLANYILPTLVSGGAQITPTPIVATIVNDPTKVYDGSADAVLTSNNYQLNGFVSGQGATVTQTASAAYASPHVNTATAGVETVTAQLVLTDFTANAGAKLSNYALPTTAQGDGTIDPAALLAQIVNNPTKVYDSTTVATLASSNYALIGLQGADAVTVDQTAGQYASKTVGVEGVSASLTASSLTAANGTTHLGDYILPTIATGGGTITPATLVVTGVTAQNKVYDATTTATLNPGGTLTGLYAGDAVVLSGVPTTGLFSDKNVGQGKTVTATGYTVSGADAIDYIVVQPSGITANITPAPLTLSGLAVNDKVYDATTGATLTPGHPAVLNGVYAGDNVNFALNNPSANFVTPNAGVGIAVTVSGGVLSGGDAGNYILTGAPGLTGTITPAPLTASIVRTPTKTYDGTTGAVLTSGNYQLAGFIGGQGATVNQTVGTYAGPNAGPEAVTASLSGGNFNAGADTLLSNYSLPISATGPGQINPAALTAAIIGDPTKPYDGTTAATLTPANYQLTGFVSGQGATVTQTTGAYASPNVGNSQITAVLGQGSFSLTGGTLLSNYILPTTAVGIGTITGGGSGVSVTPTPPTLQANTLFALTVPRTYIPFPAPGALSTWVNNAFGSLPIVLATMSDTITIDGGGQAGLISGPPMINSTQEILLTGGRSKAWSITIPNLSDNSPTLAEQLTNRKVAAQ